MNSSYYYSYTHNSTNHIANSNTNVGGNNNDRSQNDDGTHDRDAIKRSGLGPSLGDDAE